MRTTLHVLTGCTAVGKTEAALCWAEKHGAEIVSCDALLFYRGMDIGTAKPTPAERARVPHHLIDIAGVREAFDITRYVELAQAAVADIAARGRRVLVAGGSGFYLKAFFGPVADGISIPPGVRSQVAGWEEEGGAARLLEELRRLNPAGLAGLDTANPRRVVRALERCLATGRTVAELRAAFAALPGPFAGHEVRLARLERPPAELNGRILRRAVAMLDASLVDEVRALRLQGLEDNPSARRAIGYREVLDFLDGRLPEAELAGRIAADTRALVKKQRTWFRTQLPPHAAVPAEDMAAVEAALSVTQAG